MCQTQKHAHYSNLLMSLHSFQNIDTVESRVALSIVIGVVLKGQIASFHQNIKNFRSNVSSLLLGFFLTIFSLVSLFAQSLICASDV